MSHEHAAPKTGHAEPPARAPFGDSWLTETRVIDTLIADRARDVDYIVRLFSLSLDTTHRMVLLAAGVLGVVIPILGKSTGVTDLWKLHRAVSLTAISLIAGLLLTGLVRVALGRMVAAVGEARRRQGELIGAALSSGDAMQVAAALDNTPLNQHVQSRLKVWSSMWWLLEVIQYASFIGAAIYVARAF